MTKHLFTISMLLASLTVSAQVTPTLWTDYTKNPNAHSNIPNCSYAGYGYGDKALPTGVGKVYNVKEAPYSAKGDRSTDDTEAIRKAIKDAENAGGGVVYLPNGDYTCSGVLFINADNVILRGQSRDNTVIHFTKSLSDGYTQNYTTTGGGGIDQIMWSWAGGNIWITPRSKNTYLVTKPDNYNSVWLGGGNETFKADKEAWNAKDQVAVVTSTDDRGSFSFTVDDASKIKGGDYIAIRYKNPADWSLMKYFTGDGAFAASYNWGSGTGWISNSKRPYVDWVVQVESVAGNKVTLKQPLRVPLRAQWGPVIMSMGDLIKESGVENLTVKLERDYESNYGDSNWRNANHNREKGWNGIYMNNAVNCFVKDVTVYDSEMGVGTAASKNITFTGVRIHGKDKKRSTHHGMTCRVQSQDILFENFELLNYDQFDHGINVEDFSMGNVWHAGIVKKGCFDTHKLVPAECIRTNIKVDVGGGYGGGGEAGPQIGTRFVHWNVDILGNTTNTITPAPTMPMGAIVGIIGDRPSSSTGSGCIVEACNLAVTPPDLYVGQKQLRNGVVQPESQLTPWQVFNIPGRIEAEDAKITSVGVSTDTDDDGSKGYLNSFNDQSKSAQYVVNVPVSGRYNVSFRVSSDSKENKLRILENGAEIGSIEFEGVKRGTWRTVETSVLLNPGEHTITLKGEKGATCLNYFTFSPATETSDVPFPVFATQPGQYKSLVEVELIEPENTEVYYRIEGGSTTFNRYSGPFQLDKTSTVTARSRANGVWSLNNTATFEIEAPLEIPCKFTALEYTSQEGMSEMKIDGGANNQLSVGQAGDWATYYVSAPVAGYYQVNTRISIKLRDGVTSTGFDLYANDEKVASFANLPDMGGNWDRFKVFPAKVYLNKGVNVIKVVALNKRFNFDTFEIFSADPLKIPSIEGESIDIEMENYSPDSTGFGLHVATDTREGHPAGFEVEVSTSSKLYFPVYTNVAGNLDITFVGSPKNTSPTGIVTLKETGEQLAQYTMESVGSTAEHRSVTVKNCYIKPGVYTLCYSLNSGATHRMDKMTIKLTKIDLAGTQELQSEGREPYQSGDNIFVNYSTPIAYSIADISGGIISKGYCDASNPVNIANFSAGLYIFTTENHQILKFIK